VREDLRLLDFGLKESNFTTGYTLMLTIASPRKYRYAMSFSRQSKAITTTFEARVSHASLKGRKYSSALVCVCVCVCIPFVFVLLLLLLLSALCDLFLHPLTYGTQLFVSAP